MISKERLQELIANAHGLDPRTVRRYWDQWLDQALACRVVERESTTELRAENDALRALLREAREDWIRVGYGASHEDVAACRDFCDRIEAALGEKP